jgi:hypothetical protein
MKAKHHNRPPGRPSRLPALFSGAPRPPGPPRCRPAAPPQNAHKSGGLAGGSTPTGGGGGGFWQAGRPSPNPHKSGGLAGRSTPTGGEGGGSGGGESTEVSQAIWGARAPHLEPLNTIFNFILGPPGRPGGGSGIPCSFGNLGFWADAVPDLGGVVRRYLGGPGPPFRADFGGFRGSGRKSKPRFVLASKSQPRSWPQTL